MWKRAAVLPTVRVFFQVVGGYFGYSRVVRCKDTALSAERRPIQEGGLSRNNECRVKQDVK